MINTAIFDIDGVLTDGMVYIDAEGKELKRISFGDIDAVFELKRAGIKIGFITGENTPFAEYVKNRFTPDFFTSGCKDKLSYFKQLEVQEKLDKTETCFVGDSKKDMELLRYIKYSFVPGDVDNEIKKCANYVTNAERGKGVVKEVAQFILLSKKNTEHNEEQINSILKARIDEHLDVIALIRKDDELLQQIAKAASLMVKSFSSGGKLLICGNGGSAADSQHMATELVSRFLIERRPLDAEALTVNTSILTAIGNDYSFDNVFSRQVEAKAKAGDVLLAISTSGNSKNVIEAIKVAKKNGLKIIGFTGNNRESKMVKIADYCVCAPSHCTPRIQEIHILIGHILCEIVEKQIFQN